MPVNQRLLTIAVANKGKKVLIKEVRKKVEKEFDKRKNAFLREFDKHPVSKEIAAGPSARSKIPALIETRGNLFSLLGFYSNENPIAALRDFLDERIRLGRTRAGVLRKNRIFFETPVNGPTIADIDNAVASSSKTSLDWTERPFTQLLRNGIPGLPRYISRLKKKIRSSRSGVAVQSAKTLGGRGALGPIPYLEELLGVLKSKTFPKK